MHLRNPPELVFELIPKYYRFPPPKVIPCSIIAIPSPVVTKSFSLLIINLRSFNIYLFVFIALQRSPRVAGPPPIITTSALLNFG